jgi:hypothetical protein
MGRTLYRNRSASPIPRISAAAHTANKLKYAHRLALLNQRSRNDVNTCSSVTTATMLKPAAAISPMATSIEWYSGCAPDVSNCQSHNANRMNSQNASPMIPNQSVLLEATLNLAKDSFT